MSAERWSQFLPPTRSRKARKTRSGAGAEAVDLHAEFLQHGDEEIAHGRVVFGVESDVLTVFKSTPCEQRGEVVPIVGVGIAEIATKENHRVVQ